MFLLKLKNKKTLLSAFRISKMSYLSIKISKRLKIQAGAQNLSKQQYKENKKQH